MKHLSEHRGDCMTESAHIFAKVIQQGRESRHVRIDNPIDGQTVRVSGEDHLLKKSHDGSWLLLSHDFLENTVLGNSAGVFAEPEEDIESGLFDRQVMGTALGNFLVFVVAAGTMVGMVLWTHFRTH
jgi:hypothetical protein